jgi:transcriptional regulator with XRE-family HTH domain
MSNRRKSTVEGFLMLMARNVKRFRSMAGLTATEVARRAGVALGTLQKIEAGDCSATMLSLAKVSIALGVELEDLFTEVPRGAS